MQTVAEKALDSALQRTIDRKLLAHAVERQITCPVSGVALDVRRAVLVQAPSGKPLVMSADAWDRLRDSLLREMPDAEVYDGRELFRRRKSNGPSSTRRTWRP